MIEKTYTARYNRIQNMIAGLKSHAGLLAKYGATSRFTGNLTRLHDEIGRIQKRRRSIKDRSIAVTAAKNKGLKAAEQLCGKARQWVRRELPPEAWVEFGFRKGEYSKKGK